MEVIHNVIINIMVNDSRVEIILMSRAFSFVMTATTHSLGLFAADTFFFFSVGIYVFVYNILIYIVLCTYTLFIYFVLVKLNVFAGFVGVPIFYESKQNASDFGEV